MSDKDKTPAVLHPVFGTFCRTQTYGMKTGDPAKSQHVHFEIYLEDPVAKTWAVNKVIVNSVKSSPTAKDETKVTSTTVAKKLDFTAAVAALSEFEKDCAKNAAHFVPLYPDAPLMAFAHYKAFAEREGYVFDKNGYPRAKPQKDVLPQGEFLDADVKSAAKNLQREEDTFNNNGTANKIPHTLFIFDSFNRVAHKNNLQESLAETRILSILDRMAGHIEKAHDKMQEYCTNYEELGQGDLITDAEQFLAIADTSVRQLKAYGIDVVEFENFVAQCQVLCHVLHAQGLYDLMQKGKGDYERNESAFKGRVTSAVDISYQKLGASEDALQLLQDMIVQSPRPELPDAIKLFLTNYKYQREEFSAHKNAKTKKPLP